MEIFNFEVNGTIDHYGYQRSNIKYLLNKNKDKEVHCKINSPGGSVNEAIAISKLFAEHGNVVVEFIGFCASCVTFMAFGAKKIIAYEDTLWLCHKCMVPVDVCKMMNVDEINEFIKKLETDKKSQEAIDTIIAQKYLNRCSAQGKTMKDIVDLMGEEKWITAQEAADWGFIDEVHTGTKIVNEMREFMVMNCAELKLPVLPTTTNEVAPGKNEVNDFYSFFEKLINSFTREKHRDNTTQITNQTQFVMNKTFIAVNTILGIEGLTENNGKIEMNAEQLQKINEAIADATTQKVELDKAVAALDAISENVKGIDGIANKVNAVKMVVNMIPSGIPAAQTQTAGTGQRDFSDCTDPINAHLQGED